MKVLLVETWPDEHRPLFDPDGPLARIMTGDPHAMTLDVENFVAVRLEATRIAADRVAQYERERRARLARYMKNWSKKPARGVVRAFGTGDAR